VFTAIVCRSAHSGEVAKVQHADPGWPAAEELILFERLPDPCLMVRGEDGRIVDCNAALTRATGHAPGSIVGQQITQLAASGEQTPVWQQMAGGSDFAECEVQVLCRRGLARTMSASGAALPWRPGRPRLGLVRLRDLARQRAGEQALQDDLRHWRRRAQEALLAQGRERERIAAGLHDDIGQTLAVAMFKLGALQTRTLDAEVQSLVAELRALIVDASRATRSATFELSDPLLATLGLKAALEGVAGRLSHGGGPQMVVDGADFDPPPPEPVPGVLFRVARELLLNAAKHAQASAVQLRLVPEPRHWCLEVQDDGVGCPSRPLRHPFGPQGGYGLVSVSAQLRAVGGRLLLQPAPGGGTLAVVRVPRTAP
jgi:PAS domain S-box-containing protein